MRQNLVVRSTPQSTSLAHPDQLLNAQIAAAERPGIVTTARIHSAAFAASAAMHHAVMLSQAADAAFRVSPMGENLYRGVLAAFGSFATSEIERLGIHGEGQN